MREKIAGYALISFLSFCFFTLVFHTVASADTMAAPQPSDTPTLSATPTIFTQPTIVVSGPSEKPLGQLEPAVYVFPTPTPTSIPIPTISVATDLETLFTTYSDAYHTDKEELKRIANCESGFNSQARNGDYLGMFQFATQSWISERTFMGLDRNPDLRENAEEAIKTAAFMIAHGQINAWPNCK